MKLRFFVIVSCILLLINVSDAVARRMNPQIISAQSVRGDNSCFAVSLPVPWTESKDGGHTTVYSVDANGNHVLFQLKGFTPILRVDCGKKGEELQGNVFVRSLQNFHYSPATIDTTALEIFHGGKLIKSYSFKDFRRTDKSFWVGQGLAISQIKYENSSNLDHRKLSISVANIDTQYEIDLMNGDIIKTIEKSSPSLGFLDDANANTVEIQVPN